MRALTPLDGLRTAAAEDAAKGRFPNFRRAEVFGVPAGMRKHHLRLASRLTDVLAPTHESVDLVIVGNPLINRGKQHCPLVRSHPAGVRTSAAPVIDD